MDETASEIMQRLREQYRQTLLEIAQAATKAAQEIEDGKTIDSLIAYGIAPKVTKGWTDYNNLYGLIRRFKTTQLRKKNSTTEKEWYLSAANKYS